MRASRFPAAVYRHGSEPDPRFSLANERTFLAWIRTALGMLAAGVALEVLGLDIAESMRIAASLILIHSGTVLPLIAWWEWGRAERALRNSDPLPGSVMSLLVGLVVAVVGLVLLGGIYTR